MTTEQKAHIIKWLGIYAESLRRCNELEAQLKGYGLFGSIDSENMACHLSGELDFAENSKHEAMIQLGVKFDDGEIVDEGYLNAVPELL